MPPGNDPLCSGANEHRPVKLKLFNCGSSFRGETNDQSATLTPGKMIRPELPVRVEKWNTFARERIDPGHVSMFDAVAIPAGETKIIDVIVAAERLRNDVIYCESRADNFFTTPAITATMAGALRHCSAQFRG
jgi:hypothetical protein